MEAVIDAFKTVGVPLYPDPDCNVPGLVAQASTVVQSGPHANLERQDQIVAQHGAIFCGLKDSSYFFAIGEVEKRKWPDDVETRFYAENVSCTIYPEAGSERRQLAVVARAMSKLVAARR